MKTGTISETVLQEHHGMKGKSRKAHALQLLQDLVSFVVTNVHFAAHSNVRY